MASDMHASEIDHPWWREFKAAEAALNAASQDGPLPDTHPAWPRWQTARDAIVDARPADLAGLAVQLRLFCDVLSGNEPNEEDEAMLAHVAAQLEAMAGRAAA